MKSTIAFFKRHDALTFCLIAALVLGTLYGTGYGIYRHKFNQARNQAIARAKRMDGQIFTVYQVGWNFLGDTRLFLTDENGKDAGWIAMYMNNPLTDKANPLFLIIVDKTNKNPLPMKVRAHFRTDGPWTQPNVEKTKEEYTASHLSFEIL